MSDYDLTDQAIMHAVGTEIRLSREEQGLSRTELVRLMDADLSSQALANYEYGIRPCTVVRLVQICNALDVPVMDLLGLALQRAGLALHANNLSIELKALADDNEPDLAPLRTWARNRLNHDLDGSGIARLDQKTVEELAFLVGINRVDFIRRLLAFTPGVAPRWLRPGMQTSCP